MDNMSVSFCRQGIVLDCIDPLISFWRSTDFGKPILDWVHFGNPILYPEVKKNSSLALADQSIRFSFARRRAPFGIPSQKVDYISSETVRSVAM